MLLKEFVLDTNSRLKELYGPEEASSLTGILCREYLGVQRYTYMVNPELEIKGKGLAEATAARERILKHEPIQYVLGYTEFCGARFNVNPSVLIPRPETEILCRAATEAAMMIYRNRSAYGKNAGPVRILDLCTGSGCIAWTLARNVPYSDVVGIDISADAIKVAESQNLKTDGMEAPRFRQADIFDDEAMKRAVGEEEGFDILVSNPPYVLESERASMRRNVLDYEPEAALFVPDENSMVFNKKIAEISASFLNVDGIGFVEINEGLGDVASDIFASDGFREIEVIKDFSSKDRIVKYKRN